MLCNFIILKEIGAEVIHFLIENYCAKALVTFIRGHPGDLPKLLGVRESKSLAEALHYLLSSNKILPELAYIPQPTQTSNPYGQQHYLQYPINQQHDYQNKKN